MAECFAGEAGELHVVEGPVELDVRAGLDFASGGLDDGGGEEIEGCGGVVSGDDSFRFVIEKWGGIVYFRTRLFRRLCRICPMCSPGAGLLPWGGHRRRGS